MISSEEILSITENVFTTMIGCPVELGADSEALAEQSPVTGCVQISGQWTGAVLVQTTGKLASYAASQMFAISEAEVEKGECQDTMAELANMIGGNIKSLVPGPSNLSLPTVTIGKEFDIRIFGTKVESVVPMRCNGQQLRVIVCCGIAQA